MNSMMRRAAEYLKKQRDNKRWRRMVLAMAMVVALGTFGVLMLPGEAITNKNMLLACPLQVHTHTEDCYDAEGTLTCGQADYVIHTHDENCYDAEGELVCTLPEIAEHTHDASCYDEDGNLTCTQEEVIAHTHSDSCYEDDTLICGQLETTVHQHEDACFQEVKAQADDTGSAELPEDNETDETADAEAFNPLTALISFFSGDDADDGIAAQATEQTINVGDSAILKGTSGYEGKEHKWSVDKDGIVSFTDSMTNELTVTGVNTGTVTITHTYYEKKNKTATETFVVTVIDEDTTLEAEENLGYTVTVKGNKKVLTDDVTLHVEDYAETAEDYTDYYNALVADLKKETSKESITKNDFDFLHMYHIYLTKEGVEGEYVPDGNVNLQVTITYDNVPENWSKVNWVGHYKKNNGTVSGVEISDGSASSTGVKKIKVSGNSITFHIQSFSVFPIAALAGDDDSGDTGDTGESGSGTGTSSSSSGELTSTATGANGFQISTAGYYRSTNGARMKKIIEPTDIEDVFKVTVTIEREPTLEELAKVIETSGALVLQSNGSIDSKITEGGTVSSYSAQSSDSELNNEPNNNGHLNITFQTSKGEVTAKLYASNNANRGKYHRAIVPLPNGTWLCVYNNKEHNNESMSFDKGTENEFSSTIDLTQGGLEELLFEAISPSFDSVTDTIDTLRFTYIGATQDAASQTNPTTNLGTAEYSNGVITWNGVSGLASNNTAENIDNSKSMSYYVKLNTSGIDAMNYSNSGPDTSSGTAYREGNAVANISVQSTDFSDTTTTTKETFSITEPSVKGLLYYISLIKQDSEDKNKKLENAVFNVYAGSDTNGTVVATITTDSNGYGLNTPGLPWGEYTLVEATPPSGYKLPDKPVIGTYKLGYVESQTSGTSYVAEVVDSNKPGKDLTGYPISNEEGAMSITLKKISADNAQTGLSGAVFNLYMADENGSQTITVNNVEVKVTQIDGLTSSAEETGIFYTGKLSMGTYYLVETKAPDGYQLATEPYVLTVGSAGVTLTGETNSVALADDGNYTVSIPNSTGREMPETGGSGTTLYTIVGGLLILAAAGVLYNHSKRRRGEA